MEPKTPNDILSNFNWRSQWMRPKRGPCAACRKKVRAAARKRKQKRGW